MVLDAPDDDWICLNIDGVASLSCSDGTIGGLFRNSTSEWMGFAKVIGHTNSLQAELWALFEAASSVLSLVRSIHRLRQRSWATFVSWIPRNNNRPMDAMAKLASFSDFSLHVFIEPPLGVDLLLHND
ncbi:hypothetical protein V6N12_036321 [Hibiscus sabdariffa]|uniref:RNase H type-1 domain-containing protein n=1 Tax=Hibiscus sabdariffa TaxID=183260 RepID=A0ABR2EQA2_9ROSI